jgi:1,4-alpha-glucan branching enzyme
MAISSASKDAPNAQQVTVIGELDGKTYPMTKDEAGVWSATMAPSRPTSTITSSMSTA